MLGVFLFCCGCGNSGKTEPASVGFTEESLYEIPVGLPAASASLEEGDTYEIVAVEDFESFCQANFSAEVTLYVLTTELNWPERDQIRARMQKQLAEQEPVYSVCSAEIDSAVRGFSFIEAPEKTQSFWVPICTPDGYAFRFALAGSSDPQNILYMFDRSPVMEMKYVARRTSPDNPLIIASGAETIYFIVGGQAYCFWGMHDPVSRLPELKMPAEDCKVITLLLR